MNDDRNDNYAGHGSTEFDWESLAHNLGEDYSPTEADFTNIRKAISALFRWIVEPTLGKRRPSRTERVLAKRLIAAAWVYCPEMFSKDGKEPRSMKQVADSMGMHRAVLSEATSEFSKRFKFRNRFQIGHGWNFKPKKAGKTKAKK